MPSCSREVTQTAEKGRLPHGHATVKWKTQQIFQPAVASVTVGAATVTPIATTARAKGRKPNYTSDRGPQLHTAKAPPLRESVELTPGGRRKHTFTRTSPGGTTRTATYTSPTKAEIVGPDDEYDSDDSCCRGEHENERWVRRTRALEQVPGQQSDAQRGAKARSKRAAGLLPAPQMKRIRETAVARDHVGLHCAVAGSLFG